MPAEYVRADEDMVELVREVLEEYHPDLAEAHIGILIREIAPRSNGKRVMAKAKKVGPELKALLPHDFIIWFAQDTWEELDARQKRALVDHELCHCTVDNDKAKMKTHDLNEFLVIIQRYGFWWPQAEEAEQIFQSRMGLGEVTRARVEAIPVAEGGGSLEEIWGDEAEEALSEDGAEPEPIKKGRKGRSRNGG